LELSKSPVEPENAAFLTVNPLVMSK
jgi:hypothetical protein